MFWADRLAEEITKRYSGAIKDGDAITIRDEWTASGRGHVGSMRGVAIHGAIHETLSERKVHSTFRYEINDFDPMDGFPPELPEEFRQYMGRQLCDIPSPDPKKGKNFAEYFANDFKSAIIGSGFVPEYYLSSEVYIAGTMDAVITEALNAAAAIRSIYKEVSGSVKKEGWLPIHVKCPECKKIVTTVATDFDGKTVLVNCYKTTVEYTEGCGFEGRVSPFGGNSKLTWKVEWPAKWKVHGTLVEGAGKDHSTKGGSRDVANHIAREVFTYEPPFDIPYEFLLVGGKKMASSKGRGATAKEVSDLLPQKIFRLMLLGKEYNQQFNFDPEGDTIPLLFDQYDKLAVGYWAGTKDDYARLFEFVHPKHVVPEEHFLPRFSQVAFMVQMPHLNLEEEAARMKGTALTDVDRVELQERAAYARTWLEAYAPEKFVFKLHEELPAAARGLSEAQKEALREVLRYIEASQGMPSGEDLHQKLHEIKETMAIAPGELFGAIYRAFLGRTTGPQAGWFLAGLQKDFVMQRLREAVQ